MDLNVCFPFFLYHHTFLFNLFVDQKSCEPSTAQNPDFGPGEAKDELVQNHLRQK